MQVTNILIVDDEPNVRLSLAGILQHAGYVVETTPNINGAIDYLNHNTCDLVFLDINLGGKDGLQLLSFVRTFYAHTPVIILTAYVSHDLQRKALRNGASDYLIKPIEPSHIIHCAQTILMPPASYPIA